MDKYIRTFWSCIKLPEEINIRVHLYADSNELYNARIEMTNDEILKEVLKNERYTKTNGCYIIPPTSNTEYDILLVESDTVIYDLWHEMTHVYNYYKAIRNGCDYLTLCTNATCYNWDEFQARKVSTLMYFYYLENERGEKYNSQDIDMFNDLAEVLRIEIPDSELMPENAFKYNLVQYLGFVAAIAELCEGFFELPSFIEENHIVLELYNELNK